MLLARSYRFERSCCSDGGAVCRFSYSQASAYRAGLKAYHRRTVITTSRVAAYDNIHALFVRDDAVHVANPPKQPIVAMAPFMTAKIRGGKVHGNQIQIDNKIPSDKATTSCSFRLDYADIQNYAAFIANGKTLAAIWYR